VGLYRGAVWDEEVTEDEDESRGHGVCTVGSWSGVHVLGAPVRSHDPGNGGQSKESSCIISVANSWRSVDNTIGGE